MKILCFGSCNIDFVYSVNHICKPGETISAAELSLFPGGKGLNQAVALAKAGADVYFAGCIGNDGDFLKTILTDSGVDVQYLRKINGKTGHAIIQVDRSSENSIVIFSGANGCVTKEHIDDVIKDFSAGDIMLIQNEISCLPYLLDVAGKLGMDIYFNPSPLNDQIKNVDLKHVRCLIVNETEAMEMTGSKDPSVVQEFIKTNYPHLEVLLTLGKRGSVHITKNQIMKQSAYKAQAVDTTAAGDSYTGYYLAGISQGASVKNAMDRASAASAIAVSRKGASSSIPTNKEVDAALAQMVHSSIVPKDRRELAEVYLMENFAHGSINGLSACLGYSASYTGSWLKENLGSSFTDLLYEQKCRICAELLLTTDMPIGQIIHYVGCTNESFLRKKFKQHFGCTMLPYRKRNVK